MFVCHLFVRRLSLPLVLVGFPGKERLRLEALQTEELKVPAAHCGTEICLRLLDTYRQPGLMDLIRNSVLARFGLGWRWDSLKNVGSWQAEKCWLQVLVHLDTPGWAHWASLARGPGLVGSHGSLGAHGSHGKFGEQKQRPRATRSHLWLIHGQQDDFMQLHRQQKPFREC